MRVDPAFRKPPVTIFPSVLSLPVFRRRVAFIQRNRPAETQKAAGHTPAAFSSGAHAFDAFYTAHLLHDPRRGDFLRKADREGDLDPSIPRIFLIDGHLSNAGADFPQNGRELSQFSRLVLDRDHAPCKPAAPD